jgi:hypothetical protein
MRILCYLALATCAAVSQSRHKDGFGADAVPIWNSAALQGVREAKLGAPVVARSAIFVEGAQPPFSISLASSDDAIMTSSGIHRAGSPIFLLVKLANNSNKTISISSFDSDSYAMDVRDEHGNPVPETNEVRRMREERSAPANSLRGRKTSKGLIGEMKPHTATSETLEVNKYYDMSCPGKYTIRLTRQLPEELGSGVVESNAITVTVTP